MVSGSHTQAVAESLPVRTGPCVEGISLVPAVCLIGGSHSHSQASSVEISDFKCLWEIKEKD